MQSLVRRGRDLYYHSGNFLNEFKRSTSSCSNASLSDHSIIADPDSTVLVEANACSRTVILNRPPFLNALNASMGKRLQKLYKSWEENPDIGFVVMKGSGRAFCAGGDIVAVHDMIRKGNIEGCKEFFWTLYNFMYLVGTYLKPHVAILNGITMGGGAGVSIPGTFRVATDKTNFATPETLIGFHPDAGASFHLSHLPGYLGEYLALTGDALNGVEMVACGLATHYSPSAGTPTPLLPLEAPLLPLWILRQVTMLCYFFSASWSPPIQSSRHHCSISVVNFDLIIGHLLRLPERRVETREKSGARGERWFSDGSNDFFRMGETINFLNVGCRNDGVSWFNFFFEASEVAGDESRDEREKWSAGRTAVLRRQQ